MSSDLSESELKVLKAIVVLYEENPGGVSLDNIVKTSELDSSEVTKSIKLMKSYGFFHLTGETLAGFGGVSDVTREARRIAKS